MNDASVALDSKLAAAFARSTEIEMRSGVSGTDKAAIRKRAEAVRAHWNIGGPTVASVESRRLPGLTREIPVALYRPQETRALLPVFVFLHGGGFVLGNEWANDRQMREIADQWGGIVISVDYLHVPEHVFPSAVQEIAGLFRWLHETGDTLGCDPHRVAFGGTSAGASIAFGAALDVGSVRWLKAAVAIVGAFDFDASSPSMQQYGGGGFFPAQAHIRPMFEAYVPDRALRDDPRVALLRADAARFPPTLVAAAEYDVFKDASVAFAARLEQAGRLHALNVYPRMAHLFFGFSGEVVESARCVADVSSFLAERLPAIA